MDFLLSRMALTTIANQLPQECSGGEQQRVALGRALSMDSSLLLLDEAFSKLDRNRREDLWQFLKELQREFKLTTILVTHDQEEAMALGDEIKIMLEGRIIEEGQPETIYRTPKQLETARFLKLETLCSCQLLREGLKAGNIPIPEQWTEDGWVLVPPHSLSLNASEGLVCHLGEGLYRGPRGYQFPLSIGDLRLFYESHNFLEAGDQKVLIDLSQCTYFEEEKGLC